MSQKLNGGGRERASQVPDLHFNTCNLGAKSAFFLPKTLEPTENSQMKGNSGYSTHAARLPRAEGPSRALGGLMDQRLALGACTPKIAPAP